MPRNNREKYKRKLTSSSKHCDTIGTYLYEAKIYYSTYNPKITNKLDNLMQVCLLLQQGIDSLERSI